MSPAYFNIKFANKKIYLFIKYIAIVKSNILDFQEERGFFVILVFKLQQVSN